MILLSKYYREANIDQLVILKQHGENGMSRFYLPLGKKNAKPSRRRQKATRSFENCPVPADKRPPGRGMPIKNVGQFIICGDTLYYIDLATSSLMSLNMVTSKTEKIIHSGAITFVVAGNNIIYLDSDHVLYAYSEAG